MRKIKILGLVFFTFFLFLPFTNVKAADTCSKAADCKIGDFCAWTNPQQDISCGASSLHARCLPKEVAGGITLYYCTNVIGNSCIVDDECSGLSCVDKKCVDTATRTGSTGSLTATTGSTATCNVTCTQGGWFKNTRKECICCGMCTPDDLLGIANTALEWLFGIVGALGLAMFIYGGFLWVTSAGDSGQVSKGKSAMLNTVIGLVIMFASGAIILTLQKTLGIDSSKQITITGQVTSSSSSSSSSSSTGTAKNGTKVLGESCKVLSGSDSECVVGYYCKSASDGSSSGVCIPKNPQATLNPGDTCYYMPNNDASSLCKSGKCNTGKTNPVVGDKGTCPESTNLGGTCTSNTDCESSTLFSTGAQCYNGTCIPQNGRNIAEGGTCYILPGSGTNDCQSVYTCVPQQLFSTYTVGTSRAAYIGQTGICYEVGSVGKGYKCTYAFECSSGLKCDSVHNVCMASDFTVSDNLNDVCETMDVHFPSETTLSSCVPPLICADVDGTMKCASP